MTLPALALALALSAPSVPLQQGQPAPWAGELSDAPTIAAVVARVRGCDAERLDLRRQLADRSPDYLAPVLAGVVGLALGALLGWRLRR